MKLESGRARGLIKKVGGARSLCELITKAWSQEHRTYLCDTRPRLRSARPGPAAGCEAQGSEIGASARRSTKEPPRPAPPDRILRRWRCGRHIVIAHVAGRRCPPQRVDSMRRECAMQLSYPPPPPPPPPGKRGKTQGRSVAPTYRALSHRPLQSEHHVVYTCSSSRGA